MTFLILALYLSAVLWVGFSAAGRRRLGLEDYVLAGRGLTLPLFTAALVTSFYGGVLGIGESGWTQGLVTWTVMGLPYYVFAAVYAFWLCGRVRSEPGLTLPDQLERAYGRPLGLAGAGLVFLLASPAEELLMAGTLLGWALGLPLPAAMALAGAASLAYLLKGGFRAASWTSVLDLAVMYGGFFLILPFAYRKFGGLAYLRSALPPSHLDWTGGRSAAYLLSWFFIALWTLVDPGFHQRVSAARDGGTARRGILLSIAFWFLFDAMTATAGLYARAALPKLDQPLLAFPLLADAVLPPLARGLFLAGLVSSILSALHAKAFLAALSLGKDGLGRLLPASEGSKEAWTRWAIAGTWLFAFALALALPSVVGLWYAVGSAAVPGLLLPALGACWERLRVAPGFALAACLSGWGLSTLWLLLGRGGAYPLGLEPLVPGLAASALLWTLGLARRDA